MWKDTDPIPVFLFGDSAYSSLPFIMTAQQIFDSHFEKKKLKTRTFLLNLS